MDGTLYDSSEYSRHLEEEIARVVSEELSIDQGHAVVLLKRKRKEIGTLTRTIESLGIDRKLFYKKISTRVEPRRYISPNPTIQQTIIQLKQIGFGIGLVSNSGRELVEKILGAIGVEAALFDTIVTSNEAKPKPSPEPYLLAVENLRCNRNDAVYVGDREEAELRPARELGLKTVLVSAEKRKSEWADAIITNISQLPNLLIRG